jgi:uncharacterized protein (DUF433 family)
MFKYIEINPKILRWKPVIKGTRISVELILELLAQWKDVKWILENYPQLNEDMIKEAIKYAVYFLKNEEILNV